VAPTFREFAGAMPPADTNANIARHLRLMAQRQPDRAALKVPRGRSRGGIDYLTLSYAGLDAEVAAWTAQLERAGVRADDRTLVMVRQGLPLIASVFALFRLGAVPVIIDPGMGLRSFLGCVRRSRPRALVGIPLARLVSRVFPRAFGSVTVRVAASQAMTARLAPGGATEADAPTGADACHRRAAELAAVLFTSGSTGAPKGVCYEHGTFEAQVALVRETYGIEPGEIDLPLLPIFALFGPALGMTTIVPEIDPRRPAAVDPARIVQAIQQEQVTNSFGSPTLWGKIGEHCLRTRTRLGSLRRVLCAGAPVPASLWQNASQWLTAGELHSPYGATEALPVASISARERNTLAGPGACVGHPVPPMRVRIIAAQDGPIPEVAATRELPAGNIGEIIVRGPVVTKAYDAAPEATAAAKIADADGTVWHRMGDCGYVDAAGRLWFCGRKVERVLTAAGPLYTEPCEQVFRRDSRVRRCALIGLGTAGRQVPALVVEARPASDEAARSFAADLRALGKAQPVTAGIHHFFFHPRFPVDVRHNAKIHRLALARWAATARAIEVP
jgi:acyl-CoA synthetase (AMP-forming)/AMP-acid ligase II